MKPKVRAKIGLLPTGHEYYWDQYPRLKEMGLQMFAKLSERLKPLADIVAPELVDTLFGCFVVQVAAGSPARVQIVLKPQ